MVQFNVMPKSSNLINVMPESNNLVNVMPESGNLVNVMLICLTTLVGNNQHFCLGIVTLACTLK